MAEREAPEEIFLIIGDKAWSSWSLRPWLAAKAGRIPFQEIRVELRKPETRQQILQYSPSGKVPALKHGGISIWDSLAICEYLAELYPHLRLWPDDKAARAMARAVSAEMHSGFQALRSEFPMEFHARITGRQPSETAAHNIARVVEIWRHARQQAPAGGPFLFGAFSIADAMYAPVATRFRTYGIGIGAYGGDNAAQDYMDVLLSMPEMREWGDGALQ